MKLLDVVSLRAKRIGEQVRTGTGFYAQKVFMK